ncbi:MAG: hypothetical protein II458_02135 [Oscillospiraceae bacterium]|nr:hypothetical protein [Oscillospiraceae bacterium]
MTKVTTASGFAVDIDEAVLDDMELLDMLMATSGDNVRHLPAILGKLLGEEGKQRLYNHVRTDEGRVPYAAIDRELTEIFSAIRGGKN